MTTTIAISDEQWEVLNGMKKRGETFIEVLNNILKKQLKKDIELNEV